LHLWIDKNIFIVCILNKEGTMSLRVIQGGGFRQRKKATKIDRLKTEVSILKMANSELVERLKLLLKTMKEFEKESNWAVREGDFDNPENIIWLGEGEPSTIAGAVLARIRGATEKFDAKVDASGGQEASVGVVEEDKGSPVPKEEKQKPPFVIYGPDSMPAGGRVVEPGWGGDGKKD